MSEGQKNVDNNDCEDDKQKKRTKKKTRELKPKKIKYQQCTPIYLESALYSPPATASNSEKGGRVLGDRRWVSSDGGIGGIGGIGGSGGGRAGWMESSGTRPSVLSHL